MQSLLLADTVQWRQLASSCNSLYRQQETGRGDPNYHAYNLAYFVHFERLLLKRIMIT